MVNSAWSASIFNMSLHVLVSLASQERLVMERRLSPLAATVVTTTSVALVRPIAGAHEVETFARGRRGASCQVAAWTAGEGRRRVANLPEPFQHQ